jgi:hypothetical protein
MSYLYSDMNVHNISRTGMKTGNEVIHDYALNDEKEDHSGQPK